MIYALTTHLSSIISPLVQSTGIPSLMLVISKRSQAWSHSIILSFSHIVSSCVLLCRCYERQGYCSRGWCFGHCVTFAPQHELILKLGRISGIHQFTLLFNHAGRTGNVCMGQIGVRILSFSVCMCVHVCSHRLMCHIPVWLLKGKHGKEQSGWLQRSATKLLTFIKITAQTFPNNRCFSSSPSHLNVNVWDASGAVVFGVMQAGREKQWKWLQVCLTASLSGVYGAVCLQRASTQQVFPPINYFHAAAWWKAQQPQSLLSLPLPLSLFHPCFLGACLCLWPDASSTRWRRAGRRASCSIAGRAGCRYPAAKSALGGMKTINAEFFCIAMKVSLHFFFLFCKQHIPFVPKQPQTSSSNHPGSRNVLMLKPTQCPHRLPCRQSSHP